MIIQNNQSKVIVALSNRFLENLIANALAHEGMEITESATNDSTVSNLLDLSKPDFALIDTDLLSGNTASQLTKLQKHSFATRFVLYTQDQPAKYLSFLLSGEIKGLLCPYCGISELIQCFHKIRSGQFYLTPHLQRHLNKMYSTASSLSDNDTNANVLSKRESDVLHLLSLGYTNDKIAEKLCISYHTVANHKRNMVEKLNLKSSQELLPFALSHCKAK